MPTTDSERPAADRAAGVPSPCISVCQMNPDTGLCEGCLRTMDEIARWGSLDDAGKRAIWAELKARRAARRGGR